MNTSVVRAKVMTRISSVARPISVMARTEYRRMTGGRQTLATSAPTAPAA